LIAPYLPHITEEVYQSLYASSENMSSIHTRSFPTTQEFPNVEDVATSFKKIKEIVDAVRSYKTQHQLSLGSELDKIDIVTSSDAIASIELYRDDLI